MWYEAIELSQAGNWFEWVAGLESAAVAMSAGSVLNRWGSVDTQEDKKGSEIFLLR